MLALKHGAEHVRAYELNHDRFALGQEIIQRLGLQNKIELINARYDRSHGSTPVMFTETVNGNLWWEGLWSSLPLEASQIFLPGTYFLEIWAAVIPRSFAQGLASTEAGERRFNPAVDIDPQFVQVVNELAGTPAPLDVPLAQGLVGFPRQIQTDWQWIPYMRAVQQGHVVARYETSRHVPDLDHFELAIDVSAWQGQCVVLVPRMGMKQDQDCLYLDTGHWGPGEDPVLLIEPQRNLVVHHNVRTGRIEYFEN